MEKLLKYFNLSKNEAFVYTSVYKHGGCTMTELSRLTKIKRSSCQEYIASLFEKGFVVASKIGNRYYYQTEDPAKFKQIINERLFIVDRLAAELRQKEQKYYKWNVNTLSENQVDKKIRQIKKKDKTSRSFGSNELGGIISGKKTIICSQDEDIPYIEIESKEITRLHKHILLKIKKRKK